MGVATAFRAGFRSVDTALTYFNEQGIGDGVRTAMAEHDLSRSDVYVTTNQGCKWG